MKYQDNNVLYYIFDFSGKISETKYIAAAKREWLLPEQYLKKPNWRLLEKVFKSKSTKLHGTD